MNFILEYKSFYNPNDVVLIEYWYNHMLTPVKILEKKGNRYIVSHNISQSKIRNSPNETIKPSQILSPYRIKE